MHQNARYSRNLALRVMGTVAGTSRDETHGLNSFMFILLYQLLPFIASVITIC